MIFLSRRMLIRSIKSNGRYFIIMVMMFIFFSSICNYAGDDTITATGGIDYIDVAGSVVVARHKYGANITCFELDEGLVFTDCGMKTKVAAQFRQDMERRFNKKTLALFLTHAHIDHFFGMAAFADVKILASSRSKALFERQLKIEFDEKKIRIYSRIFPGIRESLKTAHPFLPTAWFDDEISMGRGKRRIVFRNTGGHSAGSSYAYYVSEGILAVGDLVQVDQYPYFGDPTTDMKSWINTLKHWETQNIEKVCPGHGRVVDKRYITLVREFFESMVSVLKKLKTDNVSVEEVVTHPDLPKGYWGNQAKRPAWYSRCIKKLYRVL
jgi:cyclase